MTMRGVRHRRRSRALSLRRTSSGWTVLDDRGGAVFAARGRDARRQCLARAAEIGVTHVRFDEQTSQ
ncbi:MAG TPA: hypothetical protein VH300_10995 [Thermoleophilaceae bacterium]|nr:hypothetical protein [Thermoleophilaceae bacterium]